MKSPWPSRLLLLAAGAAAVVAAVAVYGSRSGSPLEGSVLLAALAGGAALAFTRSFLLVSIPYAAVLFGGRTTEWAPSALYLAAFAVAFVVTISGVPAAIATPIHRSEWLVDPIGGVILVVAGLLALVDGAASAAAHRRESVARRVRHWIFAVALGGSTGALMYHELDPAYDSVFFATGNAVAASHAPATVVLFTTGLGVAYLAAGGAVRALVARQRWGHRVALGGRALAGIATALLGLAILTGRFRVVRGLLF